MKMRCIAAAIVLLVGSVAFATGDNESAVDEPVTLTFMKEGSGDMPPRDQDQVRAWLEERLGIVVNILAPSGDFEEQLRIRIAGGNTPDAFQMNDRQGLTGVIAQGVALPLDGYVSQMPNVQSGFSQDELDKGRVDGKLYSLIRRPFAQYNSLWIRQDWLDKLGLEHPTNLDEFRAVANAFTYNDPDGNGQNDTWAMTGTAAGVFFDPLFGAFGTVRTLQEGSWVVEDGRPLYSTTDPRLKDTIGFIKALIDDGVVDPELVANTNATYWDKVYSGKVGMFYDHMWRITKLNFVEIWKGVNPDAEWVQLAPPSGPGGRYNTGYDESKVGAYWVFGDHLEDDAAIRDAAFEVFDYVTAGEGHALVLFGMEGEHYTYDDTGALQTLEAINDLNYSWNYQFTGRDEMWYLEQKFPFSPPYLEFVAGLPYIPIYNSAVAVPENVNPADLHRYEAEQIIGFMYGNRPLSEWEDFVGRLYSDYNLEAYEQQALLDLQAAGVVD